MIAEKKEINFEMRYRIPLKLTATIPYSLGRQITNKEMIVEKGNAS